MLLSPCGFFLAPLCLFPFSHGAPGSLALAQFTENTELWYGGHTHLLPHYTCSLTTQPLPLRTFLISALMSLPHRQSSSSLNATPTIFCGHHFFFSFRALTTSCDTNLYGDCLLITCLPQKPVSSMKENEVGFLVSVPSVTNSISEAEAEAK